MRRNAPPSSSVAFRTSGAANASGPPASGMSSDNLVGGPLEWTDLPMCARRYALQTSRLARQPRHRILVIDDPTDDCRDIFGRGRSPCPLGDANTRRATCHARVTPHHAILIATSLEHPYDPVASRPPPPAGVVEPKRREPNISLSSPWHCLYPWIAGLHAGHDRGGRP